ncbi:MAG: metallophosphoesterase family protein [Myxococcota bacterium]
MRLMFVGDIHLGRRPTGLDEVLEQVGLRAHDLSPVAAWEATVEEAVRRRVRGVVLAGDVVEGERDRFEAYGHLERGVRRLAEAGVPVFGVAGNHDGVVLPRLADRIDGFRLLGRDGAWECVPVPGDGPAVDLVGWSFPRRHVHEDPLARESFGEAVAQRRAEAVVLGVLHADLDQPGSRYAPVARASLEATEVAAWFLGHVHQPDDLSGRRPVGYLGSLVGLDAGEHGPRGPWAVTVGAGEVEAEQIPLAPVRWERLEVRLEDESGPVDADRVHARIEDAVRGCVEGSRDMGDARLRAVVCRVVVTGRLGDPRGVEDYVREHDPAGAVFDVGAVRCIVERVTDRTLPAVDLEHLSRQPTPAGRIAQRILELESGGAEALVERARRRVEPLTSGHWSLDEERHPAPDVEERLRIAAWRALECLLAQKRDQEVA